VLGTPRITPTYPTGLPLHLALAGKILGWTAGSIAVGLFAALGAIWLIYAVARELGLGWQLAAAAAALLALCPIFLFAAVQPLSDGLATTWCLAAVFAALRARRARGWAVACGAAFAVAVLVRPTNLVLAPALLVLLGFDWRALALFAIGGLPGALWLGTYNHVLYGGALRSGYGSIFETFHLYWVAPTAWHFLKWLAAFAPAVLLVLPLAALVRRDLRTRELLALALWFGAIVGVYLFYEVSHEVWWCLRFILPAVPALILGGLLGVEALARRLDPPQTERFRAFAALALALWVAILARFWTRQFYIMNTKDGEQTYVDACAEVKKQFPPNTLILTMTFSGSFYFYTDLPVLRWDQINAAQFARFAALAQKAGRPICAVEFKWEEDKALREHCPGDWVRVATLKNAAVWRLAAAPPGAAPK
jgi:4-amino-4-deoxy-L-arabinose transferase-like glycosyltransferase